MLKNRWVRRPLVLVGLRATGDCRLVDMSASAEAPSLLLARGDYDADGEVDIAAVQEALSTEMQNLGDELQQDDDVQPEVVQALDEACESIARAPRRLL